MKATSTFRTTTLSAVLWVLLGIASGAAAQTPQRPAGPSEGITVHGHWVIDVRNPDGSLASHNEFENELNTTINAGPSALAAILGRHVTVGQWVVRLGGGNGVGDQFGPCTTLTNNGTTTVASSCDIVEPTSAWAADSKTIKNLTVGVPMTNLFRDFETGTVELSGFVTATSATQIGHVVTLVGLCAANVLSTACSPALGLGDVRGFTGRFLDTPIVPAVGQIIQVKVTLSFS